MTTASALTLAKISAGTYFLGDTIKIDAGCSKSKTDKKNVFQFYENGIWTTAGRVSYVKNSSLCIGTSRVYGTSFYWEVDRIGQTDPSADNIVSGSLQVRIRVTGERSQYGTLKVWISKASKTNVENEREASFADFLNCLNISGSWD
jgi:hypothetical protein